MDTGLPYANVEKSLEDYNLASKGEAEDTFGKANFPTTFSTSDKGEKVYIARVTPVIHYSLGGLKVSLFIYICVVCS